MKVNLYMANPNKFGGTITYVAHLYHALKMVGCKPMIYKAGKVPSKEKEFGYDCKYRTAPIDYVVQDSRDGHMHIAACVGQFEHDVSELLGYGATITVHDPNDLGNFKCLDFTTSSNIVIIRPNNTSICPNATFIPHPFVRHYKQTPNQGNRPRFAVTLSRLGAIKRTKWILEANRLLPEDRQIWLRGYDDRFFTFNAFVRSGKYPEFMQDAHRAEGEKMGFPKQLGAAQTVARQAKWLVDLTHIKGDGGGTQYAFLEAIDAGCALIINKAWLRPDGIWHPGRNCMAVGSAEELAELLASNAANTDRVLLANAAQKILPNHDPVKVAQQYLKFFKERK